MDIEKVIPENMLGHGKTTLNALLAPLKDLLNRQQFPEKAFTDSQVELLLKYLSSMDSDKDPDAARVGEREGRVASPFVERLAGGFNHGIGRSGHVAAPQPKAPGASLMQQLANKISLDAIRHLGLGNVHHGLVTPLSTGMSLALIFSGLRRENGIEHVLYPRIDHKSPQRGILLSGLDVVETPTILEGDSVTTDLGALESKMAKENKAVVLTTTTFFPPRVSDPVKAIAKLCDEHDIPHVINNAYGVQSSELMKEVSSAIDAGRVDAVVQSSDKNFAAPVGGSIIVAPTAKVIDQTAESYAGRATAAPVVQTLAALLVIGLSKYNAYRAEQKANLQLLKSKLESIAESIDERVLDVKNPVSMAMTADSLDVKDLGARLYTHRVTGPRAVAKGDYGSCIDDYPHSYLVMNAAIGATKRDIQLATTRLNREIQ